MTRVTLFTAVSVLVAGGLCACANVRPHARVGDESRGGVFVPGRTGEATPQGDIGRRGLPPGAPTAATGRAGVDSRRVCRAAPRPAGWIAVAYVSAGEGECPVKTKGDAGVPAAILTYYADRPLAALLDVCADEGVPSGWITDSEGGQASDACPGAERNGSSTRRIRRVR